MPVIDVLFYREGEEMPAFDWLVQQSTEMQLEGFSLLASLAEQGYAARRPLVENLGRGLYELRGRVGRVQLRFIFFFFGRTAVVLTNGFTKEGKIPAIQIRRAQLRKERFEDAADEHHACV
jgi:phage-related protein